MKKRRVSPAQFHVEACNIVYRAALTAFGPFMAMNDRDRNTALRNVSESAYTMLRERKQ